MVVFSLSYVVEKASKCLDFTATIVFIKISVMTMIYEFPTQKSFWVHEIVWTTVTCLLAEFLCMKFETREIPLAINDLLEQSALKAK